jgi:hypothetical protein
MARSVTVVRYKLRCQCGRDVLVDRSQAGILVTCECGQSLETPTIRGLAQLEQVTQAPSKGASSWSGRHGLMLVGLALAAIGLGWGAYRQFYPPPYPFSERIVSQDIADGEMLLDRAPLAETWKLWETFREGIDRNEMPQLAIYQALVAENRRWMWVMYALGGAGLLLAAAALLLNE